MIAHLRRWAIDYAMLALIIIVTASCLAVLG